VLFAIGFLLESLGLMPSLSSLLSKLLYELPGSRRQELEGAQFPLPHSIPFQWIRDLPLRDVPSIADLIGLKIASKACFNPEAAIESA
jgi:hypothetical protein